MGINQIFGAGLAGAVLLAFCGCASSEHRKERLVSPVQQGMGGVKTSNMPRTSGPPMPSDWKQFKAY